MSAALCCAAVRGSGSLYATTPLFTFADADGTWMTVGGETPLHAACHLGHIDCAWRLINQRGADVDARCATGCTPMHMAAFHGDTAMMRVLAAAGASTMARDGAGNTVHDYTHLGAITLSK